MPTVRRARGLTLMDVVLAAALLVLAFLAWLPGRRVESVIAREDAALAVLADLGARLDAFRERAELDRDGDGRGETPPLEILIGGDPGFRASADGTAWEHGGYWFTVLVPGPDRLARRPTGTGPAEPAEATYVLVAWPVDPGHSGMRAYLRTPLDGLLRHAADGYPYGGADAPPVPRTALVQRHSGVLRPVSLRDPKVWVPPRETVDRKR